MNDIQDGSREEIMDRTTPSALLDLAHLTTDAELEEKFRSLARRQLKAALTDDPVRGRGALDGLPQAGELVAMTRA